jgi:hypothetical protein
MPLPIPTVTCSLIQFAYPVTGVGRRFMSNVGSMWEQVLAGTSVGNVEEQAYEFNSVGSLATKWLS